jgi:hypothetical protein
MGGGGADVVVVVEGVTRSNSEPEADGGAEEGGEDVSKSDMILLVADLGGVVAGAEDARSSPPVPNISANRSWVDGPANAPPLDDIGVTESSPIRSITESLSVRVDPTGFLSLTTPCQCNSPCINRLTSAHHRSPDLRRWHPFQHTSSDIPSGKQRAKLDSSLLNLQFQIPTESSQHDSNPILLRLLT